ncbi:hypothetical protein D3C78_1260890 [compost metagenome]
MRRMQKHWIFNFKLRDFAKAFIHHFFSIDRTFRRFACFVMLYACYMVNTVLLTREHARRNSVFCESVSIEHALIFTLRNILNNIAAIN